MSSSLEHARAEIAARLRERRAEIEQAMMARVYGISEPVEGMDPEYLHGLRAAVSAAIDFALGVVELGQEHAPPVPTALLSQARLAARNGVTLDTVLRRYFSGLTLFGDFVFQEAEAEVPLRGASLHRLLHGQSAQLDRLIGAVTEEYNREAAIGPVSAEQRRAERVKQLLAGELVDPAELGYDFDLWHVGLVLEGQEGLSISHDFARSLDRLLLRVRPQQGVTWAWLGGRRKGESAAVVAHARAECPSGLRLAVGEPGRGLTGWRLTHRQAKAGLSVGREEGERVVRYADVGLLASALKDEILIDSLRQIYLTPLRQEPDGGEALRKTLCAYLSSGQNVTSTAALLGLSRPTVRARIRSVEEKIGRSLDRCGAEVELALKLERIDGSIDQRESGPIVRDVPRTAGQTSLASPRYPRR